MDGSATLTTVASRMSMNCRQANTASAFQRRGSAVGRVETALKDINDMTAPSTLVRGFGSGGLALRGRLALSRYPLRRTAVDVCDSQMRERCHISRCGYVKECVRDSNSATTRPFIRIHNRHLRVTCATPEQLVALVSDFDA